MPSESFQIPIAFDLGATVAFALTGAMAARRRGYDIVGLFFLALASGLGGGLIRDGLFILLRPRWSAGGGWLWVAPGVFLLGGAFVAWRIVRRRGELLAADDSVVSDEAGRS